MKLPLDGNPYRAMGMIAHPGKVQQQQKKKKGGGALVGDLQKYLFNPCVTLRFLVLLVPMTESFYLRREEKMVVFTCGPLIRLL